MASASPLLSEAISELSSAIFFVYRTRSSFKDTPNVKSTQGGFEKHSRLDTNSGLLTSKEVIVQSNSSTKSNRQSIMALGTVKWFNFTKGFGFIEQEEGDDLFVHKSQVEGQIREGDSVEFEVGEGPKGPNAINVKKVE